MKVWEVKKVIYDTKITEYLRDGMAVSDPLPIMYQENMSDTYLVYYVNVKKNTMSEPIFTFTIDTSKGKLISLEKWNDRIQKNSQMQGKAVEHVKGAEIEISRETAEVRKKAKEEYEILYSEVRDFFYQDNLPREVKEKIQKFYHAFCLYSGEGKIYFYKQTVPQFFEWMGRINKD